MTLIVSILIVVIGFFVFSSPGYAIDEFCGDRYCSTRGRMDVTFTIVKRTKNHKVHNASRKYAGKNRSRNGRVANNVINVANVSGVQSPISLRLPGYVAGRLVCALNVNLALAANGIKGTGSRLAKSFLQWGRPTHPVPGAVAIYNRGRSGKSGHTAIVSRVEGNRVYVFNPGRSGWKEVLYNRTAIAYRIAN